MSTKPGVTSRPAASMTRARRADDVGRDVDDVVVDDRHIGQRAGAPVPSITVPPRITMSKVPTCCRPPSLWLLTSRTRTVSGRVGNNIWTSPCRSSSRWLQSCYADSPRIAAPASGLRSACPRRSDPLRDVVVVVERVAQPKWLPSAPVGENCAPWRDVDADAAWRAHAAQHHRCPVAGAARRSTRRWGRRTAPSSGM